MLFSAPMVRALLNCSKTQTRRVFKAKNGGIWPNERDLPGMRQILRNCPYGQPGDLLFVRETWRGVVKISPPESQSEYGVARYVPDQQHCKRVEYAATQDRDSEPWRPSIHMPRWASRILLEIVSVRVERLQDISETDASAEGLLYSTEHMGHWSGTGDKWFMTARHAYRDLWESINGPGSWDLNPLVWVIEFKRVTP